MANRCKREVSGTQDGGDGENSAINDVQTPDRDAYMCLHKMVETIFLGNRGFGVRFWRRVRRRPAFMNWITIVWKSGNNSRRGVMVFQTQIYTSSENLCSRKSV